MNFCHVKDPLKSISDDKEPPSANYDLKYVVEITFWLQQNCVLLLLKPGFVCLVGHQNEIRKKFHLLFKLSRYLAKNSQP